MSEDRPAAQPLNALPTLWSEPLRVHSYEVDFAQHLTVECLCRYFQEAAWNHAEALGIGFRRLAGEGKLWVLSRLTIHISRPGRWGETLLLKTWPRPPKSVLALRDFKLLDAAGLTLAAGTSLWLVLDVRSRKPQRIDHLFGPLPPLSSQRATPTDPMKVAECQPSPLPPSSRTVRYSDIDVNGHVNGARYVGWLLDAYPEKFHRSHRLVSLEANYLEETHLDESVSVLSQETAPGEFLHAIVRDNQQLFRAHLTWTADDSR